MSDAGQKESEMLWYLASPYTKYPEGIDAAFNEVCRVAGEMIKRGFLIYSPIAHTHPIALSADMDPLDYRIWQACDAPMVRACDGLFVVKMPTWDSSKGVSHEIDQFAAARKVIRFLTWPDLKIEER